MESVWLRKAECRGKVCQLLLAEGRDLLVLGKRCAADLGYRECAVLGAFPRVLTSSWDDSIHRHWTSLGPWGSLLSCFEDPPRAWVPSARVVLQQRRNKYTRQTWFTQRTTRSVQNALEPLWRTCYHCQSCDAGEGWDVDVHALEIRRELHDCVHPLSKPTHAL